MITLRYDQGSFVASKVLSKKKKEILVGLKHKYKLSYFVGKAFI